MSVGALKQNAPGCNCCGSACDNSCDSESWLDEFTFQDPIWTQSASHSYFPFSSEVAWDWTGTEIESTNSESPPIGGGDYTYTGILERCQNYNFSAGMEWEYKLNFQATYNVTYALRFILPDNTVWFGASVAVDQMRTLDELPPNMTGDLISLLNLTPGVYYEWRFYVVGLTSSLCRLELWLNDDLIGTRQVQFSGPVCGVTSQISVLIISNTVHGRYGYAALTDISGNSLYA